MRANGIQLTPEDKQFLEGFRTKGAHWAREVTRAHILLALESGVPAVQIQRILGVSRKVVWRTRSAYREKGVDYALYDAARPGQPARYSTDQQAEVAALAGSKPPDGATRWTLRSLTIAARHRPRLEGVSRETIRQMLQKASVHLGARGYGAAGRPPLNTENGGAISRAPAISISMAGRALGGSA